MVRTKAGGNKATGAKALRKVSVARPTPSTPTAKGKARPGSNGNTYNPQSTPDWQKSINSFFSTSQKSTCDEEAGCSSKTSDAMIEDWDDESPQHKIGEGCTSDGHEHGSEDIVAKDIENGHTRREEGRSSPASNEEGVNEEKKAEDEPMTEKVDSGDVEKDADEKEETGDKSQDEVMTTNHNNSKSVEGKGIADSHVEGDDTADGHVRGDDTADGHVQGDDTTDGQVQGDDTADSHVEGDDTADGHVEGDDTADGHVQGDDTADGHVQDDDIADGDIDSKIMNNPAEAGAAIADEPGGSGFVSNGLISDDDDD